MIVTRKLQTNADGLLSSPAEEVDVEVREIWQPWLKRKCDFAVRYIIPNRANIIRIMETKGRFLNKVKAVDDDSQRHIQLEMTFKPSLIGRLFGRRNVVIHHEIDTVSKGNGLDLKFLGSVKDAIEKKVKGSK
jgi:hypothetical protein